MNKRENIYSLEGFGKVFKFTMSQTFKNKGYLVSFIIFVLVMTFMGPIQYMGQKAGQDAEESATGLNLLKMKTEKIDIYNDTPFVIDKDSIKDLYNDDEDDTFHSDAISFKGSTADTDKSSITAGFGKNDMAVIISASETGYQVDGIISEDSEITIDELDSVSEIIKDGFDEKRYEDSNVKPEDAQMIFSGVNTEGVTTESDYLVKSSKDVTGKNFMFYMLGFSMIVFIVVSMSSSYIITSVTEEKSSKLVESLLVSVRPMALLLGKVCGMMSYVVLILIGGYIGSSISTYVMKDICGISESEFSNRGFNFSIFGDFGIGGAIALILSIILAFLAFGMLSGMFGSTCNKTEDVQNATGNVMTIDMIAYFATIGLGAADKPILTMIGSLLPPFSFFMAPVTYVTGRIELPILLVSYAIQIVVIILLIRLSAKSYRNLLLSDSTTPKFSTIFKSAKG